MKTKTSEMTEITKFIFVVRQKNRKTRNQSEIEHRNFKNKILCNKPIIEDTGNWISNQTRP